MFWYIVVVGFYNDVKDEWSWLYVYVYNVRDNKLGYSVYYKFNIS